MATSQDFVAFSEFMNFSLSLMHGYWRFLIFMLWCFQKNLVKKQIKNAISKAILYHLAFFVYENNKGGNPLSMHASNCRNEKNAKGNNINCRFKHVPSRICKAMKSSPPPWTILCFRILGIFSVKNIARLRWF